MDFDNPGAQEFADVMSAEQLVDLQKLRDLARRGVPFEVRGDVWMYLLGVLAADTSNEESLIRERLAEYDSLNKSIQKLEQTIRHECSRYYQRRLIAKMKPGKPKRPAVRITEQPDREQAAAAELKRFTDKTESIICAYLNSKMAPRSRRAKTKPLVNPSPQSQHAQPNNGWDAQSASVPTRPSSRARSEMEATSTNNSTTKAAHSSAAGSSAASSDYNMMSEPSWTGGRGRGQPGVFSSSASSSEEEHHHRSRSHTNASSSYQRHSSEMARHDGHYTPFSEPSDNGEDPYSSLHPRFPSSSFSDRRDDGSEIYEDDADSSAFGSTPASVAATAAAILSPAGTASTLATLPDAFLSASTNPKAHTLVAFPDVQPDFHPALVSLCAPFVECIPNETGMYFSFSKLMQMLENYNAIYPLTERVSTFLTLFRITLPELHAYFEEEEVDIVGFATRWLQDLLSSEMRIDDVMRLWDVYFAQQEPLELHLYVCVAILMVLKDQLEELDHSECKSMLNALPALDVELIVNEAINIRLSQQQSVDDDDD
ncbi:hypothetical protein A4X13_0g8253, partial [Tilletia indica]